MKRNWDEIRDLLLKFESLEDRYFYVGGVEPLNYDTQTYDDTNTFVLSDLSNSQQFQLDLMEQAGFVRKRLTESEHALQDIYFDVTWEGFELLDSIRDATVWEKTKATVFSVGGVTLGMIKDIALGFVKQKVAEQLGSSF